MLGLFGAKTEAFRSIADMAVRLVVLLILVGNSIQDSEVLCDHNGAPLKAGEDILSPHYPVFTDKEMTCTWTVQAKSGKHVKLRASKLDIGGPSKDCTYGALSIYDGCGKDRFLVEKICSSKSTSERKYLWVSWGSCVTVQFTAPAGAKNRFVLFTEEVSDSCGGQLVTSNQTFSPYQLPYSDSELCVWIIDAQQEGKSIELRFDGAFDIGRDSDGHCDKDFVKVKGGRYSSSKTLGTYCGDTRPHTVTFQGRYLRVTMLRSSSKPSFTFTAHYSFLEGEPPIANSVCGGWFHDEQGQFMSPGYPLQYPADTQCIWKIKLAKEYRVSLTFEDFDLESDAKSKCPDDYVEVYNGPASWSPTIGRFCGKTLPRSVQSDSNEMRILFKSNEQYGGRGFKATYDIYRERENPPPSISHFTGIMIGTTCGIIFVVLSALAMFHTRKIRRRRAQTRQSDVNSTQSFDVHLADAPPGYYTVMASPEMFPSNPRHVYTELPHLHREISHLLAEHESDEEALPTYDEWKEGGAIEIIHRLGRDNSVPATEPTGEDQSGSKEDEHLPSVWYRRTSPERSKGRPSLEEQPPNSHCTTDV